MTWTVETLNAAVDAELEALPAGIRARLVRLMETAQTYGITSLHEPHVAHLEGKLWEFRAKGKEGFGRAIYVAVTGRRVVILHAFVKQGKKTPAKALRLARQRLREVDS